MCNATVMLPVLETCEFFPVRVFNFIILIFRNFFLKSIWCVFFVVCNCFCCAEMNTLEKAGTCSF